MGSPLYISALLLPYLQMHLLEKTEISQMEELKKMLEDSDNEDFDITKERELLEWSRSDSPVRMYLREMGQIPLLTKEEEIEISKKIEAGEIYINKFFRGGSRGGSSRLFFVVVPADFFFLIFRYTVHFGNFNNLRLFFH